MPIENLNYKTNTTHSKYWLLIIFIVTATLLPLYNAWQGFNWFYNSVTAYSALGGVIPYSDAHGYWTSLWQINDIGKLSLMATRRPLANLWYGALMHVVDYHFYAFLMIEALCIAAATSFIAYQAYHRYKIFFALLLITPILLFATLYTPTTLTESYGLLMGCLSFVVFWHSWSTKKPGWFSLALFLLTLSLTARSGPYFLLPFFILMAFFHPITPHHWRHAFLNVMACGIAIGFSACLPKLFGDPNSGFQSNFALTLYGLVNGGKTWVYAFSDPFVKEFLNQGNEVKQAQLLYAACWEIFRAHPHWLVLGLLKSVLGAIKFYLLLPQLIFSKLSSALSIIVMGTFALFASWNIYKTRNHHRSDFILMMYTLIALICSSMVIWTDGGIRVFAVAVPWIGLIFAYSLPVKHRVDYLSFEKIRIAHISTTLCSFIISLSLLNAFLPNHFGKILPPQKTADQILVYAPKKASAWIWVTQNTPPKTVEGYRKTIPLERLKTILHQNDPELEQSIFNLLKKRKETLFLSAYDVYTKEPQWMIADPNLLTASSDWWILNTRPTSSKTIREVISFQKVSEYSS